LEKKILLLITLITLAALSLNGQNLDTLVNVGEYDLHFKIIKGKSTSILFETGAGDDCNIWNDTFLDSIFKATGATIITYDRSGFGKSRTKVNDMSILEETKGLESGLKKLGYFEDIIIVAHSYGGFLASLFANRNMNLVKGYVAIDANIPCMFHKDRLDIINEQFTPIKDSLEAANIGLFNLVLSIEMDVEVIKEHPIPENVPIIDIVAEKQYMDSAKVIDCHKTFVSHNENRDLIIAENCGHYIFLDNPKLVIDIIAESYKNWNNEL
jgi:pimeloyl-ACP methyl ester carboxylesterase